MNLNRIMRGLNQSSGEQQARVAVLAWLLELPEGADPRCAARAAAEICAQRACPGSAGASFVDLLEEIARAPRLTNPVRGRRARARIVH